MIFNAIISPGFMKKIDHHLLVNHPEFWRTRAHYFFYYSFILGNIAAIILPMLIIRPRHLITINQVEVVLAAMVAFFGFCFLFWGYSQFKFKLKSGDYKHTLATILVYIFCLGSLFSNIFTLNYTVAHRMAAITNNANWDNDVAFLQKYNYLNGYGPYFNGKFSFLHNREFHGSEEEWSRRYTETLDRMGVRVPAHSEVLSYDASRKLKRKIKAVKESKEYIDGPLMTSNYRGSGFHGMIHVSAIFFLMSSILLPPLLLLLSTVGFASLFVSLLLAFVSIIGTVFLTFLFGVDRFEAIVSNLVIISILGATVLLFNRKNSKGWRLLSQVMLLIIPFTVLFSLSEHFGKNEVLGVLFLGVILSVILTSAAGILNTYLRTRPQV